MGTLREADGQASSKPFSKECSPVPHVSIFAFARREVGGRGVEARYRRKRKKEDARGGEAGERCAHVGANSEARNKKILEE